LIKNSESAGKFDFSLYDNLRKSISANPLYSASGFLNLDEVKLEQVSLTSMAKNAGKSLKETFKFLTEGAQQFAKDFEKKVIADLQRHVRGLLAPYEYPKEIEFIAQLPMTTTGKVQRRFLRLEEERRAKLAE
jgi:acyl-CoA synthetase (AMP-forming)/AMP-acid ligase II